MMNPQQTVRRLSILLLCTIAVKSSENLMTYQLTFAQLKLSSLCQVSPWVLISSDRKCCWAKKEKFVCKSVYHHREVRPTYPAAPALRYIPGDVGGDGREGAEGTEGEGGGLNYGIFSKFNMES